MSINTTITESPVILFLGAGASVPLGKPVMNDFVAKLSKTIASENEASLLEVLISARGYDLEAIMTDLETFISLDYVSSFDFGGFEANLDDAENLRSMIRHAIIQEYRTIDTERTNKAYQPLFDTIFTHLDAASQPLPVFTTNYDLAIESFCRSQYAYELTDGLDEDSPREVFWNPTQFEWFKVRGFSVQFLINGVPKTPEPRRNLILFKLHGSVNWMRVASTGKIVQSLPMYDVIDSDEYQNTIIYPAGNKVVNFEPYLTAYHYFSRCCEHAKLVIAIGYSFRDYDALTSLLKARQENEDLKLLILSPNSYDIRKMLDDEEWFLWTESIYGYFGSPESEVKYLLEIDKWLSRQLKSQKDNSANIKSDLKSKKGYSEEPSRLTSTSFLLRYRP
jgi:hypothetical protein